MCTKRIEIISGPKHVVKTLSLAQKVKTGARHLLSQKQQTPSGTYREPEKGTF